MPAATKNEEPEVSEDILQTTKNVKRYVQVMEIIRKEVAEKVSNFESRNEVSLAIFKQFFDDQNSMEYRAIQVKQLEATLGRYL